MARKIGKSNLSINEVGFGCMSLNAARKEESIGLLREAFDGGINYFDTADLYDAGENERLVGLAFEGIREKVVIATKVGNQLRTDGSGWDWNPSKDYILSSADGSLKRLKTDYIDLYQLHGGTMNDPIDETIEAFEMLKKAGKIRYYGISSIRPEVIREYVKRSNIVSVMMQYGILDPRPEESCLSLLEENNISVLTRGTLAKGLLINKPSAPFLEYSTEKVARAAAMVKEVAGNIKSPEEVAVKYVLHHPAVAAAVIGIRTKEQLAQAIKIAGGSPLTMEEINQINTSVKKILYQQYR